MIRHVIWDFCRRHSGHGTKRWLKERSWFKPVAKALFGNTVYSASYYTEIARLETASTEVMADWVVKNLKPARIIDVGCGGGLLLEALLKRKVAVFGVDVSDAAAAIVKAKGLPFQQFNLVTEPGPLPGVPYDLAISCEVAEHLEPVYADQFVRKLTQAAPRVYLTAAEPKPGGYPGLQHFNEQPNEYWIELMRQHGFQLDHAGTASARETFGKRDVICYLARPMIFFKKPAGNSVPASAARPV